MNRIIKVRYCYSLPLKILNYIYDMCRLNRELFMAQIIFFFQFQLKIFYLDLKKKTYNSSFRVENFSVRTKIQEIPGVIGQTESDVGGRSGRSQSYRHSQFSLKDSQLPQSRAVTVNHIGNAFLYLNHKGNQMEKRMLRNLSKDHLI